MNLEGEWQGRPKGRTTRYKPVDDSSAVIASMEAFEMAGKNGIVRRKMKIEYTALSIRPRRPSCLAWKSGLFIMRKCKRRESSLPWWKVGTPDERVHDSSKRTVRTCT